MKKDIEGLVLNLSNPPKHKEWGIGSTPGGHWQANCRKSVIPALSKHMAAPNVTDHDAFIVLLAILTAFETAEISNTALKESMKDLMERCVVIAGDYLDNIALKSLSKSVLENSNYRFVWSKAVDILQARNYRAAAPVIVKGLVNRYSKRRFQKMFSTDEVRAAIKAITVLELSDLESVLEQLLSVNDNFFKRMIIDALGNHGNVRALNPLRKRLRRFLGKGEKDKFYRGLIKKVIKEIKARA